MAGAVWLVKTVSAEQSSNTGKSKGTKPNSWYGHSFKYSQEELVEILTWKLTPGERNKYEVFYILV